ncbi:MAG: 2-oxoglutarate dehydrogenase E1 component [Phycisphaerales bacterium]
MSTSPRAVRPSVNGWNAEYLDAQYTAWQADPQSVSPDLRAFFMGLEAGASRNPDDELIGGSRATEDHKQAEVTNLINAYREYGHLCAEIDPFGEQRERPARLSLAYHDLDETDLDRTFDAGTLADRGQRITLRTIVERLEATYCRSIGIELGHISDADERDWWEHALESQARASEMPREKRAHTLYQLYRAEQFEKFCGKRYPGVKRFSLEGGESLIPMLDAFIEHAGDDYDVEEIVFAMSHRGRLNVLTNIVGKTYQQIFTEFDDSWAEDHELGGGDVKYHRGYSSNRVLPSGKNVWLAMTSNPSHLEAVGPVMMGRARAKQRLRGDVERRKVIPLLMHGDAAFIGQGVVAEMFQLSQLEGYTVGGTVHVVVNNLIGFTTGQDDARSSRYCTDMAKTVEAPVMHVSGEDPEACVRCIELALDYRMRFGKDVVIDMQCYRRHGHNETDEASFTQPLLYRKIKDKPSVVTSYANTLRDQGVITDNDLDDIIHGLDDQLDQAYTRARRTPVDPTPNPGHLRWQGIAGAWSFDPVGTAVDKDTLARISTAMGTVPDSFTPHRKLKKLLEQRRGAVASGEPMDWGTAEALAVGSLLVDGTIVRMSGQDSRRGTFSHRHAVIRDNTTGEPYCPLNHIQPLGEPGTDRDRGTKTEDGVTRQAKFCIYDSPLSEFAVLGFEYGFSLAAPDMLVMWEAQFGDFCNGAQVVIDQFIASAEAKWQRWTGLTLLLPHGYEGQGPEHSSARLERFLKLCGQNNMQVCVPTNAGQYFHLLRRQVLRPFRKPLVIMTPKSLLRSAEASCSVEDLTAGSFREIIDDPAFAGASAAQKKKVKRLILCTGKVYYDLAKRRDETGRDDVAIVRMEQVYPIHDEMLEGIVNSYPGAELVWCQEEPKNMGAWGHVRLYLGEHYNWELPYFGRPPSASPATGSPTQHAIELDRFLSEAVAPLPDEPADAKANGAPKNTSKKAGSKKTKSSSAA